MSRLIRFGIGTASRRRHLVIPAVTFLDYAVAVVNRRVDAGTGGAALGGKQPNHSKQLFPPSPTPTCFSYIPLNRVSWLLVADR